jgi:GT2 family glycosyltransferase
VGGSLPLVVTVIPNYNGGEHLLETLASLAQSDYGPHRVLIVDDCSTDQALQQVAVRFPDTVVLRNAANRGFAYSVNVGMAESLRQGAECVFLLNNDVVVSPTTIRLLMEVVSGDQTVGATMPMIYFFSLPEVIQSAGLQLERTTGASTQIGREQHDDGQFTIVEGRQGLHGCAMMVTRRAWEEVGQFWEPYFAYYEEADWCIRARDRGYRLSFVPRAHVWHHGGLSWDHASPQYLYLLLRNRLYFVKRNHGKRLQLGDAWIIAADYLRTFAGHVRRKRLRHAAAVVRAIRDYAFGITGPAPR